VSVNYYLKGKGKRKTEALEERDALISASTLFTLLPLPFSASLL